MRIETIENLAIGECFNCVENCPDELRIWNTKWMKIAPVANPYGKFMGYRCIELSTGDEHMILDDEVLSADLRVEVC